MDYLIFCEDRNMLYKGVSENAVTLWTRDKNEEKKFSNIKEANTCYRWLRSSIPNYHFIKKVKENFKLYL